MMALRVLSMLLLMAAALQVHAQTASVRFDALDPASAERAAALSTASDRTPAAPRAVLGDTLFSNGPLITNAGAGGAPDTSRLNPGENILGFGHSIAGGNRIADDFTVSGGDWQVDSVKFFAYQTNSGLTSTINALNLRIWNGPPGAPGSIVVWGDATTNVLSSTRWSRMYRTGTPFSGARPVMLIVVNVNTVLSGGTYWLDWQAGGSASFSGPWIPPVTVRGDTAAGNALQFAAATGWTPALDDGNPPYPAPVQKAVPFIIEGSVIPYLKDILVSGVTLTPAFPPIGSQVTVAATIENLGTEANPTTVPLTYKPGSAPTSPSDGTQQDFTPVWTGAVATVTFATSFTATTPREFAAYVRAYYPGDQDGSNDIGMGTEYALPDTDLVVQAFGQVNGIPVPFGPAVRAEVPQLRLRQEAGIPASSVGHTAIVRNPQDQGPAGLALRYVHEPFDQELRLLPAVDGIGPVTMEAWVQNLGFEAPAYDVLWSVGDVVLPPVSRPGVLSLVVDTVQLTGVPVHRGTLAATATVVVPGDSFMTDNVATFPRTLVYPSPNLRLRYDDGSLTVNTNIGFGGGTALTAGVRFTAAQTMRLANVDAIYTTEGSSDSILVQVRAAGPNDSTAGPVIYAQRFGGPNYLTSLSDYFTLPLGGDAPVVLAGQSFWVSITFTDTSVAFPMAAQNIPPATAGRSFFSGNGGASWTRLRVGAPATERAWMLRLVGVPYNTLTVQHVEGWNMLSNPVETVFDSVRHLFPTAVFPHGFSFEGLAGYVQRFRMMPGAGYWVKMPVIPVPTVIGGTPMLEDSVEVRAGWNLIGSVSDTVDTGAVTSVPPGIRETAFFGYPYAPAPLLLPGQGYWVKVGAPGVLYLSAAAPPPAPAASPLQGMGRLIIRDASGLSQTLYMGTGGDVPASLAEMPPLPPEGAFDVRFVSPTGGTLLGTHAVNASAPEEMVIRLSGLRAPVTVGWDIPGGHTYTLVAGENLRQDLAGEGEWTLPIAPQELVLRPTGVSDLPREYALGQNYPNPFNPATTISYELPEETRVTLTVFDLLGREVAVLVDEVQKPGVRSASWTATGAASGVYYYRLTAGGFTGVGRMMVLK
jgi:hypothetical protein